jgi:hypothetical protein
MRPYTRPTVDLPLPISDRSLAGALAAAVDVEGKIARAIEVLGPVADRDVLLLDAGSGLRLAQLVRLGGRVRPLRGIDLRSEPLASADVVVAFWTWLGLGRAAEAGTLTGLARVLRPGGRLLLVEDYGRDDTTHLYADADREARLTAASDRRGAMLAAGFRVRVLHCFWTFADLDTAAAALTALFPDTGATFAAGLRRPRISHKVAVYHRSFD